MQETSLEKPTMRPPKIETNGLKMLVLDPLRVDSIKAKRCEDPTQGFDLEIDSGRVTVRITLDEAIKMAFFIQAMVEAANRQIKQKHDQIMSGPLPSQGPGGVGLERSMDFLATLPGAPPSEEGSEPKARFMQGDDEAR